MFPTLEVKFDFFYSLTKRIQGDSYGLLKEAVYNISDVGYSILVPGLLVLSCTIIASANHSCTAQLCPVCSPALDNAPRSRVPPM
jgi:hypothetical protein